MSLPFPEFHTDLKGGRNRERLRAMLCLPALKLPGHEAGNAIQFTFELDTSEMSQEVLK